MVSSQEQSIAGQADVIVLCYQVWEGREDWGTTKDTADCEACPKLQNKHLSSGRAQAQ